MSKCERKYLKGATIVKEYLVSMAVMAILAYFILDFGPKITADMPGIIRSLP